MKFEMEQGLWLVRLADGLWIRPDDVSALQDRRTGERQHTNIILRNGVTVALTKSSADQVVERIQRVAEKKHG